APCFIPLCRYRLLEPWNGVIPFLLFNQVGTDIVVRIAELRIQLDGLQALRDSTLVVAEKGIRPAAEGIRFCCWKGLNGLGVQIDGTLEISGRLLFVGLTEKLSRCFAGIRIGHNSTK